jgi:Zn-finger nucleic acid-binding protein
MQRCPTCESENLQRKEREGVEEDYCPECEAWIDPKKRVMKPEERRGEKDQFASRSEDRPSPPPAEDAQTRKNM